MDKTRYLSFSMVIRSLEFKKISFCLCKNDDKLHDL